MPGGGGLRDDSVDILFQCFLQETLESSSGMGRVSTLWCCPSCISSADQGVVHPPRCPGGWFWRGCQGARYVQTMQICVSRQKTILLLVIKALMGIHSSYCSLGAEILVGKSAGLVIERLRVPIPAGAAGEFSSPESTLCADSYSVSVPSPCYRSGT